MTQQTLGATDLNLWPHQSQALATVGRYIQARRGRPGPSAMIRMPTGTGKSGVIAVTAHRLVEDGDVLVLTPWDALVDQLADDVRERFWRRIGTAAPDSKFVHRIYPSTVADNLRKLKTPGIWTATIATLQQLESQDPQTYSHLARRTRLVIVDEGHYEPAPTWSRAVRGLGRPTVLFTATPYRNDFKFFDVDRAFCFFYSHHEAEAARFIRRVKFESHEFRDVMSFCDILVEAWQRLFKAPRPRVIVRCATKNSVQTVTAELSRRDLNAIGIHERFPASVDGPLRRHVPSVDTETADFWVHQNKLVEGIDDPRFRLVAFLEPFANERAFIQQVGRVLRNPGRKSRQYAWVLGDPNQGLEDSWDAYLAYDARAGAEVVQGTPKNLRVSNLRTNTLQAASDSS